MSLLVERTPHASCSFCSSLSNQLLRAAYIPTLGRTLTTPNVISTGAFPRSKTLRTRWWRSEVEKDVAKSARDPSSSVENAEVTEEGRDSLSPAKGFGSGSALSSSKLPKDSKSKVKRSPTVRRTPPAKPVVVPQGDPRAQQLETVFIFSWAFLGSVILSEGIVLGASGFLPEGWDDVVAKYIYPSFTPAVGLFLTGAVFYGLYKYFDGGKKPN